jgi:hypothetical protein
MPPKKTTARIL